jgi:hypothetical protein
MLTPLEYKLEALHPAWYEIDVGLDLSREASGVFSSFTNWTILFALLLR